MPTVGELYRDIGVAIGDPNNAKAKRWQLLTWINIVLQDAARMTDCLQTASTTVTGDGTAESFDITTGDDVLTRLHRIISVTDATNGVTYLPVKRRDWNAARINIVTNSITDRHIYNLFGYDANMILSILPVVVTAVDITVEHSQLHATLTTVNSSPSGLLNDDPLIVIKGVERLYWDFVGDKEKSQLAFEEYMQRATLIAQEVGINPEIKPEMSQLFRRAADVNSG